MFRNYWFVGIQFIIVAGQIMIIFVGGRAFAVHKLKAVQWAYCLILGALSMPVAVIIRLLPDEIFAKCIPKRRTRKDTNPLLLINNEEQPYVWNPALEEIREELSFLKKVRGGRLSQLKYKLQHPSELITRSRSNSVPRTPNVDDAASTNDNGSPVPPTPESRSRVRTRSRSNSAFGPAAAMAGIVAGSIAGGWSPIERSHSDLDSMKFTRSRSHSGLDNHAGIEIHPDTAPDDPIIGETPLNNDIPPSQNPELAPSFERRPSAADTNAGVTPTSRSRGRSLHSRHSSRSAKGPTEGQ